MVKGVLPGEFEQVVLLALAGFETDATGREVYEVVAELTGRDVSVAAIHITLGRAAEKGWADCTTTPPAPGEGGKPRKRYGLSQAGASALARQRSQIDKLWGRAATNPLMDGAGS